MIYYCRAHTALLIGLAILCSSEYDATVHACLGRAVISYSSSIFGKATPTAKNLSPVSRAVRASTADKPRFMFDRPSVMSSTIFGAEGRSPKKNSALLWDTSND